MKFIIVGAGELGCLLASTLLERDHDVILLDSSPEELERVSSKLDVMTVEGSCSSVAALKKAGAESAHTLLAVSGDEAANILACQIASRLGVQNTVCRLYRSDAFSEEDGIGASTFGIWRTFSPPEVCAEKIADVLFCDILLERIRFSRKEAQMAVIEIERSSILAGLPIKDNLVGLMPVKHPYGRLTSVIKDRALYRAIFKYLFSNLLNSNSLLHSIGYM